MMIKPGSLKFKFLLLVLLLVFIMLLLVSCDKTILDIYTEVNSDFSGKRIVDIAVKTEYIKELLSLVETKYGKILDKCQFIFLCGGGSVFFKTTENGFIRVPKTAHSFYNAIGFALFGLQQLNK